MHCNLFGIIVTIGGTGVLVGASLAAWFIRAPWRECDCCGELLVPPHHGGILRCDPCDTSAESAIREHVARHRVDMRDDQPTVLR